MKSSYEQGYNSFFFVFISKLNDFPLSIIWFQASFQIFLILYLFLIFLSDLQQFLLVYIVSGLQLYRWYQQVTDKKKHYSYSSQVYPFEVSPKLNQNKNKLVAWFFYNHNG